MRPAQTHALLMLTVLAALPASAQHRQEPAQAQQEVRPVPSAAPTPTANPEHGREIAANGTQQGTPPCGQCHGMDGSANGNDAFPRIDGQSPYYLFKQLNDYAAGVRDNPIMGPIAQGLSAAERQDVAAYFGQLPHVEPLPTQPSQAAALQGRQSADSAGSSQNATGAGQPSEPAQASAAAPDPNLLKAGRRIVTVGIAERGVQNCGNCHGPAAAGMPPATPRLAGQWASYTQAQFQAFRDGTRKNDVAAVMRDLARRLSDDEVAAVAAYLATERLETTR